MKNLKMDFDQQTSAPPTVHDYLRDPAAMPLDLLIFFTAHYYKMSNIMMDKPNSPCHRYYYCFALECERRKLDLRSIIEQAI